MNADWRTQGAPEDLVLAEQNVLAEIVDLDRTVRRMTADLERVLGDRRDAINRALAEGHSQADIGRLVGMSRARINQLAS